MRPKFWDKLHRGVSCVQGELQQFQAPVRASTAPSSVFRQALVNADLDSLKKETVGGVIQVEATRVGEQIEFPTSNMLFQHNSSDEGHQEQDLQDHDRKLKELKAQQQTLQKLQAQLQEVQAQIDAGQSKIEAGLPPGGNRDEKQSDMASERRPSMHFDPSTSVAADEADILEAQLQRALFGEAAPGLVVDGEGANLPIAESTLLEPTPTADELEHELASIVDEVWDGTFEDVSGRLETMELNRERNLSPSTKRRSSQVEGRNSQSEWPAPAARVRDKEFLSYRPLDSDKVMV